MNTPGKCSNFLMCFKFCILLSHHQPKPQKGQSKLKIRGKQKSLTLKNTHLKTHKKKEGFKPQTFQNAANPSSLDIVFDIHPLPTHTTEGALALLHLLWLYKVGVFFDSNFFLGTTTVGFGAGCEAQGPWPLCWQPRCHFLRRLCSSDGNSPKCTNLCLLRAVFHTIREHAKAYTQILFFQRCIIIKSAFSLSCPHTSARPDTSGSNEPKMFGRYSALVVTRACSSTGYGAFQCCICTLNWTEKPISHSQKTSLFPILKSWVSCIPPTNKYLKKTCLCLSFVAVGFQCHTPFQCLSTWGTWEAWNGLFFLASSNANLTFL